VDPALDLARAAIPPIMTALIAATVKWSVEANRRRTAPPPASLVILPPGVRLDPRPRDRRREFRPLALMGMLPPVPRRTSPWKAATIGGLTFGLGLAVYFRTWLDLALSVAMAIAIFAGFAALAPSSEAGSATAVLVFLYSSLAVVALYGALRATSSNRRRHRAARRAPDERRRILLAELDSARWRVESVGQYDAVAACIRRPRHWLHFWLSFYSLGLWVPAWVAVASARRRRPRWCYYRLFVDQRGELIKQEIPAPA
jgi:hypothetical protein